METIEGNFKSLVEPYEYLCSNSGKQVRTQLINSFNQWLNVPKPIMAVISEAIEMLHNASLLIDDIEDNSTLRRGEKAAHIVFGTPLTINCSNLVYFLALKKLEGLNQVNPKVNEIYTEEMINLHKGQGMDLFWRDTNTCPTEEDYIQMISNKTGGLLRLSVKLMQLFSESKIDLVPLVDLLGIHFQIRDDYINLCSEEYMKGKGYCDDISEGKFSLPIIDSIRNDQDSPLMKILSLKTTEKSKLDEAVNCIKKTNSLKYTLNKIVQVEADARKTIQSLGGNFILTKILDQLSAAYSNQ